MDFFSNPFSPGAGNPPPELAGRTEILEKALLALARIKMGRTEKSLFLVGLRGVGKTVLLNTISQIAQERGYKTIIIEAQEKKNLPILLLPHLRQILFSLSIGANVSDKVKRDWRVLQSFISSIKLKANDIELSLGIEPERGTADSGDLEADLMEVFVALGEAAQDRQTAIAIIIDELQYLNEQELSALIMAVHKTSQRALPVIVIGAGLPQLVGKAGKSKSYAERLFHYPNIGPLKEADAKQALQQPASTHGVKFTDRALNEIVKVTQGYPYFLQEWGYEAWNLAEASPIDIDIIKKATPNVISRLDEGFFKVRFDRLTAREKDYVRALAELGNQPQRSGNIAEQLGVDVQSVAPFRNNLIKKGMIYSPTYGSTAFTVPLFEDFLKRTMPMQKTQKESK